VSPECCTAGRPHLVSRPGEGSLLVRVSDCCRCHLVLVPVLPRLIFISFIYCRAVHLSHCALSSATPSPFAKRPLLPCCIRLLRVCFLE
jgi:hypothetical protein